jgi:hypothetical protein
MDTSYPGEGFASLFARWCGGAGVGGASIRMKLANAWMSEMTAGFEMPLDVVEGVVVKLRLSLGVGVKRQLGVSSRSCGNSWFEIPISTL